jgi:molybdate transport system substrate-binding protein
MKMLIPLSFTLIFSYSVLAAEVTVFAASSLTDVLSSIGQMYEKETKVKINFNFGASSRLARQIAEGAKTDLFFSADKEWNEFLEKKKGLIAGNSIDFLGNQLTIVTNKKNNIVIQDFEALRRSKFKILCLAQETVPAGRYAYESLKKMGMLLDLKSRIVNGDNVRNVLAWVARNEADLAIVFTTDAKAAKDVKELLLINKDLHSPIIYPLSLIGNHPNQEALLFYMYLQGKAARRIYANAGFKILIE